MIRFLFLDLDDTILDFHKAEREALARTLVHYGVEPTEAVLARYHTINQAHWQRLERGELTREEVLVGRFGTLFAQLGQGADPEGCAREYEEALALGHDFLPGAREAVGALSRKYRLFLASNGTASVQHGRMTGAGLYPYFEQVFVSQQIGVPKPDPAFFRACFDRIPGFRREEAMMVGDSLTSDMRGANNAGISACWVNPAGLPRPEDITIDYEIRALAQLPGLLEEWNHESD